MKNVPYASAVGSIMYAVRCTRPDVAFAQNMTSRFQQNPGEPHWTAVKNILKYLRNTKDMFLVYGGNPSTELRVECYCDVGFETDRDDTKSQTGYVSFEWRRSGLEELQAKVQCNWLGIVPTINEPLNMYCDNSAAVHYANEPGHKSSAWNITPKYSKDSNIVNKEGGKTLVEFPNSIELGKLGPGQDPNNKELDVVLMVAYKLFKRKPDENLHSLHNILYNKRAKKTHVDYFPELKEIIESDRLLLEVENIIHTSIEEVCSKLEDLLDTLPTLLSDNDLVFSNMCQNEKELNRHKLPRMLANVKSYTPVVFAAEQFKEVWSIGDFPVVR
ncbi:hypothetical protein Tco_0444901 [Tanacetum coccineum]